MRYTEEMFAGMYWNVYPLRKNVNLFNAFKDMNRIPEFNVSFDGISTSDVVRYMVYMYDPHSPLQSIDNLALRKKEAAEIAGIKIEKGKFPDGFEEIIDGKNVEFNKMVVAFLKRCAKPLWRYIIVMERRYSILTEKALDPEFKRTSELQSTYTELQKKLSEFLSDDNSGSMLSQVYDYILQDEIDFSPEAVVDKLSKGEKPFE